MNGGGRTFSCSGGADGRKKMDGEGKHTDNKGGKTRGVACCHRCVDVRLNAEAAGGTAAEDQPARRLDWQHGRDSEAVVR